MANQTIDDIESTAEKELDILLQENQVDLQFDFDKTLNEKAKKNKLTKMNVKNLIKNVLINEDVVTMLRQTLNNNEDANCLYEPKLTRAKIKEMLKAYPSAQQWSLNQQKSIISECRLLIEKEFADDSEDEEYHPDKTLDDDDEEYDDFESKVTEMNKSFEIEKKCNDDHKITVELNDKETIGMRTRSKLSLNDTPLEMIELAFIPPDITEDMYDSACENDEWMEFLTEFTKPLEPVQNYDMEDDPEYNVLCDIDITNVDEEEFRKDKSVKISRKEYNELMNELTEFTDSFIEFNGFETFDTDTVITENVNDKNTVKPKNCKPVLPDCTNSNNAECKINSSHFLINNSQIVDIINTSNPQQNVIEQLKNSNMIPVLNVQQYEENTTQLLKPFSQNNTACVQINGMTSKQIILLKQQLAQHTQLITQSFLLCSMTFKFKNHCQHLRNLMRVIKDISTNKIYEPINIDPSLIFIKDWKKQKLNEIDYIGKSVVLPKHVKEYMYFYNKPVFIYPKLLPIKTFDLGLKIYPIGPSEEKFLLLKIHYESIKLKENHKTRTKYKKKNLTDLLPLLLKTIQRRWFPHRRLTDLKKYMSLRKNTLKMNIFKNYLLHNKIDDIIHEVSIGSLYENKCLYEFNISNFPLCWKSFIRNLNKRKNNI